MKMAAAAMTSSSGAVAPVDGTLAMALLADDPIRSAGQPTRSTARCGGPRRLREGENRGGARARRRARAKCSREGLARLAALGPWHRADAGPSVAPDGPGLAGDEAATHAELMALLGANVRCAASARCTMHFCIEMAHPARLAVERALCRGRQCVNTCTRAAPQPDTRAIRDVPAHRARLREVSYLPMGVDSEMSGAVR